MMTSCMKCEKTPPDSTVWRGLCRKCADEMDADIERYEALRANPPCQECGAMTPEEAQGLCRCGGDKDDCHGCQLWPD